MGKVTFATAEGERSAQQEGQFGLMENGRCVNGAAFVENYVAPHDLVIGRARVQEKQAQLPAQQQLGVLVVAQQFVHEQQELRRRR